MRNSGDLRSGGEKNNIIPPKWRDFLFLWKCTYSHSMRCSIRSSKFFDSLIRSDHRLSIECSHYAILCPSYYLTPYHSSTRSLISFPYKFKYTSLFPTSITNDCTKRLTHHGKSWYLTCSIYSRYFRNGYMWMWNLSWHVVYINY